MIMNDIDEAFKKGIQGYNEKAGEHVWQGLEARLNRHEAESYKKKYYQAAAAVIFLFLLSFSIILFTVYKSPYHPASVVFIKKHPGFIKSAMPVATNHKDRFADQQNATSSKKMEIGHTRVEMADRVSGNERRLKAEPGSSGSTLIAAFNNKKTDNSAASLLFGEDSRLRNKKLDAKSDKSIKEPASILQKVQPRLSLQGMTRSIVNTGIKGPSKNSNILHDQNYTGTRLTENKQRWGVSVFFSPDLVGKRLNQQYEYNHEGQDELSSRERNDLSFTLGMNSITS